MPGFKAATLSGLYRVTGGGDGARRAASRRSAPRPTPPSRTAPGSSCSPTGTPTPSTRRSRRCCSPPPSTTTSSAPSSAPRSACSSRPATCARSTTSRCSSATAPPRSTRTWPWSPSRTWSAPAPSCRASSPRQAIRNLIKALGKGVLKVMSKMGISTVASYRGAQVFEAVGLDEAFVDDVLHTAPPPRSAAPASTSSPRRSPPGTPRPTRPPASPPAHRALDIGGEYQWRREGEPHLFDPETVFRLQHSTRTRRYDIFKQYTDRVDEQSERLMTLRGLFGFKADRAADPDRRGRAGRARSSSASPPAPCRTAPSPRRRTRPSPSP